MRPSPFLIPSSTTLMAVLTAAFLILYHGVDFVQPHKIKLIFSSRVIDRAKPLFHFFQFIFVQYFGSNLPLPLCRNVEGPLMLKPMFYRYIL